jgi:hypothetical protein
MTLNKIQKKDSPDLKSMQEVVIDRKTSIYIEINEDPVKARERYLLRAEERRGPGVKIQ